LGLGLLIGAVAPEARLPALLATRSISLELPPPCGAPAPSLCAPRLWSRAPKASTSEGALFFILFRLLINLKSVIIKL